MKLSSTGSVAVVCILGVFAAAAGCGSKGSPAAPSASPSPVVTMKVETPVLKSPTSGLQLDTLKPTLSVANAVVAGSVGTVTYEFEVSEMDSFPQGSRTSSAGDIAQGGDGVTTWDPPSNLIPNLKYFWRARAKAANVANPTEWSPVETFRSQTKGFVISGQEVYDPLTDGATIGSKIGGHFVPGGGWQAIGNGDAIYYDFGACTSCTMEFDVTNFGRAVGASAGKDYKWVSMGNANGFGDFFLFREDPWKMHLEQRSDGDGTGMKLIWRNGSGGDGNPGDHEERNDSTVDWKSNVVYHFTLRWTPSTVTVSVGSIDADGQVTGNRIWFEESFGGRAYTPPSLRIALGCYPRSDTMVGAIWRNVHIVRN
jgi:hypothetical protein